MSILFDDAFKRGVATTLFSAAATAGAIAGAIIVTTTAGSSALIVASVALGIFTLISALGTAYGCSIHVDEKPVSQETSITLIPSSEQSHIHNMKVIIRFFKSIFSR